MAYGVGRRCNDMRIRNLNWSMPDLITKTNHCEELMHALRFCLVLAVTVVPGALNAQGRPKAPPAIVISQRDLKYEGADAVIVRRPGETVQDVIVLREGK